jgi:hypothetical protein
MSQPKNLTELLTTCKDVDMDSIDRTLDKNPWCRKFRSYLEKRDLQDEVVSLKFLVLTQAFVTINEQLKHLKSDQQGRKVRTERNDLFRKIVMSHFHENGELISMSNDDVAEALSDWTRDPGVPVSDLHVELLLKAREDDSVWSEGLEPTFQKFLSQTSQSKLACLLTIL